MKEKPDTEEALFMFVGGVVAGVGVAAVVTSLLAPDVVARTATGMLLGGAGMIAVGVALFALGWRSLAKRRASGVPACRHTPSYTILRCTGVPFVLGGLFTIFFVTRGPLPQRLLGGCPMLAIGIAAFLGAGRFEAWERRTGGSDEAEDGADGDGGSL